MCVTVGRDLVENKILKSRMTISVLFVLSGVLLNQTFFIMTYRISFLALFTALMVSVGCSKTATPPAEKVITVSFKVDGMVCQSCEKSVKTALTKLDGVKSVEVSQPDGKAIVVFDESKQSSQKLIAGIEELGYKAVAAPDVKTETAPVRQ
jgi:copper chaperone CopZ